MEALEGAREAVQSQRAVSIEAALRGQESPEASPAGTSGDEPNTTGGRSLQGRPGEAVGAAILEELRALRVLVEEQNRRLAELEETVRGGRELEASSEPAPEKPAKDNPDTVSELDEGASPETRDPGPWRRVLAWFGFGVS